MSAYVYRAFDKAGRLLYVGSSIDPAARIRQHQTSAASEWTIFHDRTEVEEFATADEAANAETRAIQNEHPRWNIKERHPDHPDGFSSSVAGAYWLQGERDLARDVAKLRREAGQLRAQYMRIASDLTIKEALVEMVSAGQQSLQIDALPAIGGAA